MNETQATVGEAPIVEATRVPAPQALTIVQGHALEQFGGEQEYTLAKLSEEQFKGLLEKMKIHYNRMKDVQRSLMRPGVHYGIPGKKADEVVKAIESDGTKVGLYKPGMQVLLKLLGLVPDLKLERTYGDPENVKSPAIRIDSFAYIHRGSLDGPIVAVGVGTANSWETKYRYRNLQRKCPSCGAAALMLSKFEAKGGALKGLRPWWCNNKPAAGGCGAEFAPDDKRIVDQEVGRTANPDAHDLENTLVKMSGKRSTMDGTITAAGASDLFTQDLEDLGPEARARIAAEIDAGADATVNAMYGEGASGDPDDWRDEVSGAGPAGQGAPAAKPAAAPHATVSGPSAATAPAAGAENGKPATDPQKAALRTLLSMKHRLKGDEDCSRALRERYGVPGGMAGATVAEASRAIQALNKLPDAPKGEPEPTRAQSIATSPAAPPAGEGPLVDNAENRVTVANQVRHHGQRVEEAFSGRAVFRLDEDVRYLVGGNELALLKLTKPTPLEYLDVGQLLKLKTYLKAEADRRTAVPA